MKRPGFLNGYRAMKPRNLGDSTLPDSIIDRNAILFLDDNSPMPPEVETGYIPDHVRFSRALPYGLRKHVNLFNPKSLTTDVVTVIPRLPHLQGRPFVQLRDPKTFNTLLI